MNKSGEISEKRLLRLTAAILLLLTAASWFKFADWRVPLGVFLGGVLSFLNLYWLKLSLNALLGEAATSGARPRFNSALYVLRYLTIATIIAFAATFNLVSVAATLVGLLSFAFAILLEALIQIYFIIVNREED